jgi:DNA-binding XRE family transcriptional regulator|tara:strand:- start:1962 stop:2264 length:303 start_codon:yes stop_codon:yes gene_type:complete
MLIYAEFCGFQQVSAELCGKQLDSVGERAYTSFMNGDSKLKRLRLEAQLSQAGLARLAEIDRGTVAAAEKGKQMHELSVSKICTALSKKLGRRIQEPDIV